MPVVGNASKAFLDSRMHLHSDSKVDDVQPACEVQQMQKENQGVFQ